MIKSKQVQMLIAVLLVDVVFSISLSVLVNKRKTFEKTSASSAAQRQLLSIDVLETTDFNFNPPQFQLHIQHVVNERGHDMFSSTPQKIVLINKKTNKTYLELPLMLSEHPNECATMMQDLNTFKKWTTSWFTVEGLIADFSYRSKLADQYWVIIIYKESGAEAFSSINPIGGVCYQIPKVTPLSAFQETTPAE